MDKENETKIAEEGLNIAGNLELLSGRGYCNGTFRAGYIHM